MQVLVRSPIAWLTVVLVAAHVLFGCCSHHAHRYPPACQRATEADSSGDLAQHRHGGGRAPHGVPGRCQGTACAFLGGSQIRLLCWAHPAAALDAAMAPCDATELSVAQPVRHAGEGGGYSLPVRLHLLHQVLQT